MIHIVLDTNIYRNNPARDNLHFKALEKLSKAGLLCLHVPYVVLREFQTQQRDIYSKDLVKAISGLTGLSRKLLDEDILERLVSAKAELEGESENILSNAEDQITNWCDRIGAKLHPLCLDQASLALEAYFQGKPPLKSVKNREDIPDSFIVQSILKLHDDHNPIHVVAGDNKVREAFADEKTINTYESLSDFIEIDLIQDELKEVDLIDSIGTLVAAIQEFEDESSEIKCFLSNNIGESIVWKTFSDPSIPDDNHKATINSYDEAEDIELDFSEAGYYGNGQFGIPFKLRIVVLAHYYIFKSDYYCMDPEREHVPSVSDHNDHYFEAEEEFELCVSGLVSITIDRDNIDMDELSESIVEDSFKIDEVSDIELC
ncbi:PIN domain-containing protein [Vibrio spartinae]|uniref:DUF4935 domain-containing protein n=1 Tax=Vibrio spartinae TaxID=1918945 RepID=A0ABX6QY69_9VIBR|nr:PIN domain-containing protein [Vibrio spartinae]QMV13952.1 hypothetical protein Vspart_01199 [Vibrio spartinae]